MDRFLDLLPARMRPAAKAYISAIGVVATIVVPQLPNVPEWAAIPLGILTVLGVYQTPWRPTGPVVVPSMGKSEV